MESPQTIASFYFYKSASAANSKIYSEVDSFSGFDALESEPLQSMTVSESQFFIPILVPGFLVSFRCMKSLFTKSGKVLPGVFINGNSLLAPFSTSGWIHVTKCNQLLMSFRYLTLQKILSSRQSIKVSSSTGLCGGFSSIRTKRPRTFKVRDVSLRLSLPAALS